MAKTLTPFLLLLVGCSGPAFSATPAPSALDATAGSSGTTAIVAQGGIEAAAGAAGTSAMVQAGDAGAAGAAGAGPILGHAGDSCSGDGDCDVGAELRCIVKSGTGTTCQVPVVVRPGTSCSGADQACPADYFCDGAHCVQLHPVGAPCSVDYECEAGLACSSEHCEPEANK